MLQGLGVEKDVEESVYDLIINEAKAREIVKKTQIKNLDICPSNINLAGAEVELVSMMSREYRLKEKLDEIKKYVEKLDLNDHIRFLGNRADAGELYQAMDVFVMPSLFEGLPVVGVEAQFSGLPCIFSDKVPEEVEFTDKVKFIPLNDEKKVWANIVIAAARDKTNREMPELRNSIFNIEKSATLLTDYYKQLLSRV